MKLIELMNAYITFRQSLGAKFTTERYLLLSFCNAMGDVQVSEITSEQVLAYFKSSGPSKHWHRRYYALNVFFRYAISRGHLSTCPLPLTFPKRKDTFVPYIYSFDEVRLLLAGTKDVCSKTNCILETDTLRTILLLLWGTGLRLSEALNLTPADIDLDSDLIVVKDTKFFKTRLVPMDPRLTKVLSEYFTRQTGPKKANDQSTFFSTKLGNPISVDLMDRYFRSLCKQVGVVRTDTLNHYQPRLHDLRHTFAVSRIVFWYENGANVQRLLPHLSTYLGHRHLAHTQRYLTVTPEVLRQACNRFEKYALEVEYEKH